MKRQVRAETRAHYYVRKQAVRRGWSMEHLTRGGECLEQSEISAHFPDIGLDGKRPDFLLCLGGAPTVVIEAKKEIHEVGRALEQAKAYADAINATGRYTIPLAVGAAGEEDTGFMVELSFRTPTGWRPFTANGFDLTTVPSKREVEQGIRAGDATTNVSVPDSSEFIDAAIEISGILRSAKIEAPLRPKVIGAIVTALYEGKGSIDLDPEHVLGSINSLVERAIEGSLQMPATTKSQLIDALRLSSADFDRLAPSVRRVVAILRRLNVRVVLQSDTDFLGLFYEAFLRYGYDNKSLGIVFTPRHITRFCVDLVGVKHNDRVIDVAAGTGGFLVAALDRMLHPKPSPKATEKAKRSLAGFDTNPTVWALAMLNLFFRGDDKTQLQLGSCFAKANRDAVAEKFTRAFLNPPFSQQGEPECDFIDAAMDALDADGELAAVVYAGVFADADHEAWRQAFLKKHTVVGLVSLTEDLFYPTAAPTTILVARAHAPHRSDDQVVMAKVWNDGFQKLKGRRVECVGSELETVRSDFARAREGKRVRSRGATVVKGAHLLEGPEWSPEQWLPQAQAEPEELALGQELALRSIYQAVARFPDLADAALDEIDAEGWVSPDLPLAERAPLFDFFAVSCGRSSGEKNYSDGEYAYVSSGDSTNSVVRLVAQQVPGEMFEGGVTVTAFGTATLQPWPYLARGNGGSAVRVLSPRFDMSARELLWFVAQINRQRWRFHYGRMAINARLAELVVQSPPQRLSDDGLSLAENIRMFRRRLDEFSRLPEPSAQAAGSGRPTPRVLSRARNTAIETALT